MNEATTDRGSRHPNVSVRGEFAIEVRDVNTGEVVENRPFQKNLLLDNYLNGIFDKSRAVAILIWDDDPNTSMVDGGTTQCVIGDDSTGPDRAHDAVLSDLTSITSAGVSVSSAGNSVWRQEDFVFPAGAARTVEEIGLRTSNGVQISRQLFHIDLEVSHELHVAWRLTVDLGAREWTDAITDGQRTGGVINCTTTINDAQIANFLALGTGVTSNAWWDDTAEPPFVHLGTSNIASDLANDGSDELKQSSGGSWDDVPPIGKKSVSSVSGRSRTLTIGFADNQPANMEIGEMVVCNRNTNGHGMMRITFDPQLDKYVPNYEMFIDLTITVNP